ncbi:hypothetical protein ABPG75_011204 [Micractinium tetrahymenae]
MDDWDMEEGSSGSDSEQSEGSAGTNADAAALGLDARPPEFYDPEADDKDEAWVRKMRRSHHSDAILSCPLCFTTLCIDCQQHDKFENQFRAMFVMNCRVKPSEVVAAPQPPRRGRQQRRQQRRQEQQQQQQQEQQQQQAAAHQAAAAQEQQGSGGQQLAVAHAAASAATQQEQQREAQQRHPLSAPQLQQGQQPPPGDAAERLNPVCCAACDTEVGLRDPAEGVYHFFNVFASNS